MADNQSVSVFKPLAFTKLGLMLEAKLRTGVPLKITRVVIGDGSLDEGESVLDITALKHEIPSHQTGTDGTGAKVDMSRATITGAGITNMRVVVESNDSDFVVSELAFMAEDPDVGEIPYLYTHGGTDAFKEGVTIRRTYDFTNIITNATDISVKTTITDGVSVEEFEEFKKTMFDSPAFTGSPTAPTPATSDNSGTLATTEHVHSVAKSYQPGIALLTEEDMERPLRFLHGSMYFVPYELSKIIFGNLSFSIPHAFIIFGVSEYEYDPDGTSAMHLLAIDMYTGIRYTLNGDEGWTFKAMLNSDGIKWSKATD